jgi:hypothetical protein
MAHESVPRFFPMVRASCFAMRRIAKSVHQDDSQHGGALTTSALGGLASPVAAQCSFLEKLVQTCPGVVPSADVRATIARLAKEDKSIVCKSIEQELGLSDTCFFIAMRHAGRWDFRHADGHCTWHSMVQHKAMP